MAHDKPAEPRPEPQRMGRFYLDFWQAKDHPALMSRVFEALAFFPLRCEMMAERMQFYYIGYSPEFDLVQQGDLIPEYDLLITVDGEQGFKSAKVTRINPRSGPDVEVRMAKT